MIHELKCLPKYFGAQTDGSKSFEVRKNDRNFQVGDFLALNEYDGGYTGACMLVKVTYVLDDAAYCKPGYVVMGTKPCRILGQREERICNIDWDGIPVYRRP